MTMIHNLCIISFCMYDNISFRANIWSMAPKSGVYALANKPSKHMSTVINDYVFVPDIQHLFESIQPDSIISRTVYTDSQLKVVIFGFDAGQALSEHSASQPAIIHILQGEAVITLVEATKEAS